MKTISDYTIYCTPEQIRKAMELGAQIKKEASSLPLYGCVRLEEKDSITRMPYWLMPVTAEQMIGILESLGIWVEPSKRYTDKDVIYTYDIYWDSNSCIENEMRHISDEMPYFPTRKEATLAAIDAALEYLTNNKK